MAGRGRPNKLGCFEATTFFMKVLEYTSFLDVKMLIKKQGLIVERMSRPTIHRLLGKWGMRVSREELPPPSGPARIVMIWMSKWEQPAETRDQGMPMISGVLWRILTGKGLMAFMLTKDGSSETAARVALAAAASLGSRKRKILTNDPGLKLALQTQKKGWPIDDC